MTAAPLPRGNTVTDVRITKIEMIPISAPWKTPFAMGPGELIVNSNSLLLKLHTDAGIVGIADTGNTSPWYRGETVGSIMEMITEVIAPQILFVEDPLAIEKIVARMDFLILGNNHAKMLVDFALHDLKGKVFGLPVYQLLGGKSVPKVKTAFVMSASMGVRTGSSGQRARRTSVPGNDPKLAVPVIEEGIRNGYTAFKLKTGHGKVSDDIRMVAEIRAAVGDDIELWVDPNGRWTYEDALTIIRKLDRYHLKLIEQPLPPQDKNGLARLRRKVGTPIWADEAAQEPMDLLELIQKDAVDGLILKVNKAGGLLRSQRWITLAQSAGLSVMCGCMGGNGLEAAAYTHLLIANEWASRSPHENIGPLHIHDVFNTVDEPITDDLALHVPRYEGGYTFAMEGPGLGIELNEPAIARMATPGRPPQTILRKSR